MDEHSKVRIIVLGSEGKPVADRLRVILPPCCYETVFADVDNAENIPDDGFSAAVFYTGGFSQTRILGICDRIKRAKVVYIVGSNPGDMENSDGFIFINSIEPDQMAAVVKKTSESLWASERLSAIERNAEALAGAAGGFAAMGKYFQATIHDMKNTIAVITGHAQTMLGSPGILDGGDEDFIRSINTIEKHAHRMLDRLNLISATGAIRSELRLKPCGVREIQSDLETLFSTPLRRNEMTMVFDIDAEAPRNIVTDRSFLVRALSELIFNAIENSREEARGTIDMKIGAGGDKGVLKFEVRDDGRPMSDIAYSRMFEPFFTEKEHRAGLGLPTARTLVSLIGGSVWAERTDSARVAFVLEIPVQER